MKLQSISWCNWGHLVDVSNHIYKAKRNSKYTKYFPSIIASILYSLTLRHPFIPFSLPLFSFIKLINLRPSSDGSPGWKKEERPIYRPVRVTGWIPKAQSNAFFFFFFWQNLHPYDLFIIFLTFLPFFFLFILPYFHLISFQSSDIMSQKHDNIAQANCMCVKKKKKGFCTRVRVSFIYICVFVHMHLLSFVVHGLSRKGVLILWHLTSLKNGLIQSNTLQLITQWLPSFTRLSAGK